VEDEVASPQLQPVDGGSAAWRLLCAAFVFEALLWGEASNCSLLHYALSPGPILIANT
jgi:hypothetical protein